MVFIANILILLIALEHAWFAVLEILLWQKPLGLKTFRQSPQNAATTAVLAKNQGTYNLFLAGGLLWGLLASDAGMGLQFKIYFLGCVVVAGLVGGFTVSKRILLLQSLPAALALALVIFG